jgi:hypothetical protein
MTVREIRGHLAELYGADVSPDLPGHRRGCAGSFEPQLIAKGQTRFDGFDDCECHTISTMPRFQPPPRRTQRADFLALRSSACFAPRLMGPILPERLSALVEPLGSH